MQCNGLSHGGLWALTKACYTDPYDSESFGSSNGTFFGYTSGNRSAAIDFMYSINNYTGTCAKYASAQVPFSRSYNPGYFCCEYLTPCKGG
jgi:hypothetical protein